MHCRRGDQGAAGSSPKNIRVARLFSTRFHRCFAGCGGRTLASMRQIDPRADTPLVDWSDLDVSGLLPTGTVTLLLADVEGSTRL